MRGFRGLFRGGFCHGLVDELEELGAVDDFDKGRGMVAIGDHPDGGRVLDADALAEGVVGLDLGSQLALRVDGERQRDAALLREFLSELAQSVQVDDGGLVGENRVAILIAQFLLLVSNQRALMAACMLQA